MTDERKEGLKKLIKWYWDIGEPHGLLRTSDYEFLYSLWRNGVSIYNTEVQTRLNDIRTIYANYKNNDNI